MLTGAAVLCKSRFKDTISLSSTETECIAAMEAGKYIPYLRSILNDVGLPQDDTTVLYQDIQGYLLMPHPNNQQKEHDILTSFFLFYKVGVKPTSLQ